MSDEGRDGDHSGGGRKIKIGRKMWKVWIVE